MSRAQIVIVTPALADSNNGNWRTARRWASFLAARYRIRLTQDWQGGDEALMIALHARRSAGSIAAWRAQHPQRPLLLVLTGTDLYRDIAVDLPAQRSLALADRIVVLNEEGARALPAGLRERAVVVLQSCPARSPAIKTGRRLRALMVGHLRTEKAPGTYFEAVRRLAHRADIVFDHVGGALDPALAAEACALAATAPRYRWLGAVSHAATRARIRRAHVLVHPSRMEGGAQVVIEAVRSGTPVIASRIDGNVGLLGEDYDGYFPVDDARELAAMLERARDEAAMLPALQAQCDARAALFDPARESEALRSLVASMLN
ncbi:MAG: selenoneine biosynthesis selenosugar synthase SenB [Gammaproteobacteria bacterium]